MDNSPIEESSPENSSSWMITGVIISIVLLVLIYVLFKEPSEPQRPPIKVIEKVEPIVTQAPIVEETIEETPEEPVVQTVEENIEVEEVEDPLPPLNQSDIWVQEKLTELTWRKELLRLMVNDDMIRRFVVFTDNFSQGTLAYEHSPFIKPTTPFSVTNGQVIEGKQQLLWDENSYKRFSVYVDLIRSFDSETLVQWYFSLKPLIDKAYAELGYPDEDFTNVLREAIVKVLDMELPKEEIELDRPSVMYRYKSKTLESLDGSEKLLLRIGKQNLLVIKSVLLEINEKLARNSGR